MSASRKDRGAHGGDEATSETESTSPAGPPPPRRRESSTPWGRRLRRVGTVAVALLAAVGLVATWNFFAGPPGVGHFRSAAGEQEYTAAYDEAMARLPEPSAVHDIRTSHGTMRVYEWATEENREKTPVVLVPGRASGVPMWAQNLPALTAERRVLAFDAIGDSGMSQQSVPFASFEDQARPIDDMLEELAPQGAHLVGHSFGGAVATAYARQYPERTVTLTLLEPAFTLAQPPVDLLFWAMLSSLPFLPEGIRDTALEKVGGEESEPGALEDDPMARMITAASAHYSAALPQPSPLTDTALSQLTMPVYVAIASDHSLAGGGSAVERAEQLPRSTVHTWPETTHSLPMQATGELEPALLSFFAAHEPS